jgi:hypothetical protein
LKIGPSHAAKGVLDNGKQPPGATASADGIVLRPIRLRLADPPEFDVMARVVALRLRERWGGWNSEPPRHQLAPHQRLRAAARPVTARLPDRQLPSAQTSSCADRPPTATIWDSVVMSSRCARFRGAR